MIAAMIVRKKTLIDLYLECGESAHFIALSAILFLWLLYVGVLRSVRQPHSAYFQALLLSSSLLPIVIGVFGSAIGLCQILDFAQSPQAAYGDLNSYHTAEVLIPLIAGSFLTAIFLFLTMTTLFIRGSFAERIKSIDPT